MLGLSLFLSLSFTSDRRVRDTHPRSADCVHLLVVCLGFGVCKNGPTCLRSEHVARTDQTEGGCLWSSICRQGGCLE